MIYKYGNVLTYVETQKDNLRFKIVITLFRMM